MLLSEIRAGGRYRSIATGQLLYVVEARCGKDSRSVKVKALSQAFGQGSARSIPAGETRLVNNGFQWAKNVEPAPAAVS